MGYGVMAFAVEFDAVGVLFGCGEQDTLDKMLCEMAEELAHADEEERENEPELEEDELLPLPASEALRQIIMGEELDRQRGHVYAYLVKAICMVYDEFLDNSCWCPIRSSWLTEQFDSALGEAGVPPDVFAVGSHLLNRGCPFAIPAPDDFPAIGYLTPDEILPVVALLERIDPERFRPIGGHEQFAALRNWLMRCRDTGRGLICFYH